MTTTALTLIPAPHRGGEATRTAGDRLEVLAALMTAPSFDPVFRQDVISVPGDHPVYRWLCGVPDCQRPQNPGYDYCWDHWRQWSEVRKAGGSITDLLHTAIPLQPKSHHDAPDCLVCPGNPASSWDGLCWHHHQLWSNRRRAGEDFDAWLPRQRPYPSFGQCQVEPCPERAAHPIGLCLRHKSRYEGQGSPGRVRVARNWRRWQPESSQLPPVSYDDESRFRQWCRETGLANRSNGKLSLLGLRPLVRAEIQWCLFTHAQSPAGSIWPFAWVQYLVDHCRTAEVDSLVGLDLDACTMHPRKIAKRMLQHLRLIYFTRADSKDAGFIETDHFGVRFAGRDRRIDLTHITQRWLRDLIWDAIATRLTTDPPRSRNPIDTIRRGCAELSAFLDTRAPGGGHDPTALAAEHMIDFVADQRHRAEHGLTSIALFALGGHGRNFKPTVVTKGTLGRTFNGARRVLRAALDNGSAEAIGLDRGFIVALPNAPTPSGRRRPFSDEVAKALADETNLESLAASDVNDRGARDIWETLVLTGRRCKEVREVRLECLGRHGDLPLFWHDQTKVGHLDEAIRIPERLHQRLLRRQEKTVALFVQRHGRPPTAQERLEIALFPRLQANRTMLNGAGYGWFHRLFRAWVDTIADTHCVPHQARHTLATNLLRNGADLTHVKRYLGHVSNTMAEHYVHLANTDPKLNDALNAIWVGGPGSAEPGSLLSGGEPMTREEAEAMAIDLTRKSTPAEGGFCTFQPVVNGDACPWNLDCHNCDKFVLSGADLVYWHRKREHWRMLAEGAPDGATADYLHGLFEPTARAIASLERALEAVGLLDEALALDLRRPQDYFGRVWATAFRAQELAQAEAGEAA
ncbi:tyrosine-type recombinase/integrase [Streptomyces anulatus]|uniref:tyrosine-type recombinase/integrase n=1 Tax=Streptomyces anulatus TaxID=1892 RepID=UPI0036C985FA